ncbi:MAG: PrsW family glutamic-type intramembrane protease [Pyrinomonadaceae bacterium]
MKLVLTITRGSLEGRSFPLESGFLTIGRSENCTVRFDSTQERIASKQHAFIEAKLDGFYLTDNASTNGTLLNGERIAQPAKLNDGDSVQFGRNGLTSTVAIEQPTAAPSNVDFRRSQLENYQSAATAEPINLQNSISNIGLGQLGAETKPSRAGKYIGIGVTIFAIVFMALIVVAITFASVGIGPAIVASLVAFTPAMLYLLPFMWLDRYDPEPLWLLALAFAWGALVAVIFSFVVNTFVGVALTIGISPDAGQLAGAVFSAPLFEEGSKGFGLVILLIFFRKYFDDVLDGIVFAGVIALGFATVENVMYYGTALGEAGIGALIFLFIVRGILSPFAHTTFTAMTGIGCGIARESHNRFVKLAFPIIGYVFAVTLHAIWNGLAMFSVSLIKRLDLYWMCESIGMYGKLEGLCAFLVSYSVLEVPLFLIFVVAAFLIMRRQNKILKEMLAFDIARGLIPEAHGKIARSAFRSSGWLLGGLFSGKYRNRSRYLRAIGKLGLSYWHIQRATAAQGNTGSFQQNPVLREEVLRWRDQVD